MFTEREAARRVYTAALADSRWRAYGLRPDERDGFLADRRAGIAHALTVVERAVGTDRIGFREPDDAQLAQMAEVLRGQLGEAA